MKLDTLIKRYHKAKDNYHSWWKHYCNCHLSPRLQIYRMNLKLKVHRYQTLMREAAAIEKKPIPPECSDYIE